MEKLLPSKQMSTDSNSVGITKNGGLVPQVFGTCKGSGTENGGSNPSTASKISKRGCGFESNYSLNCRVCIVGLLLWICTPVFVRSNRTLGSNNSECRGVRLSSLTLDVREHWFESNHSDSIFIWNVSSVWLE